jgi:hypothetical protein
MAIERLSDPPRAVPLRTGGETLYEIQLNAAPSPQWRAAFLHPPPPRLVNVRYSREVGWVGVGGNSIHFRTTPDQLDAWLYRIDGWITYANSAVAKGGS